jgi:hypothetical protein
LGKLLNFAETWDRNWNYEGHVVDSRFTADYGYWNYTETTYEPWLFDRASVGYMLYELTGDQRWKDKFLSDFAWYRARIDAGGIFTPKGQDDSKYSYVRPFYYYEQLTGDTQYRPIAKRIHDRWLAEFPNTYSTSQGIWTEREIAFALDAAIFYHKITGDAAALNRSAALVAQWSTISAQTGAPLHTLEQHGEEFPPSTYAAMKMTSSWMSALYFQAAREYYDLTGNQEVLTQVSRYADFIDAHGIVDGAVVHVNLTGLKIPYYLYGVGIYYDRETPSEGDMDHCLDVGGIFRFAVQAKQALGQSSSVAQTRLNQMQACADRNFSDWTRTTLYLPKYRLSPPRKFNWQFRGYNEQVK